MYTGPYQKSNRLLLLDLLACWWELLQVYLAPCITAIVGLWKTAKDADEKLKDRISDHALQLTKMDYELRQKSLDTSGTTQKFLAPVKVYRTFYRALYELHTTGGWPKEVEEQGLLNIFELGLKKDTEANKTEQGH